MTAGVAVTAVGGAGVLAGYFAHALPGRHAAGSAVTTSGTTSAVTGSGNTGNTGSGGTAEPNNTGSAANNSGSSSNGLSAPPSTPRHSRAVPQVVSGSS